MINNTKKVNLEWVNSIPNHWHLLKIKNVLNERNIMNKDGSESFLLSLTIKDGVIPYSEKTGGGNKAKEDITKYKVVKKDDIVLNSMNVVVGASGISKYDGIVSPVYYIFEAKNNISLNKYYEYLFLTTTYQNHLFGMGNGIMVRISEDTGKMNTIRKKIPIESLKQDKVLYPPLEEQIRISDYLDKKITKIETIIKDNLKSISILEEYKLNLINTTVKKQDGWKKVRIKNISTLKGRIGWQGLTTADYIDEGPYLITGTDFVDGSINWDSCVHITEERYDEAPDIHITNGDLLITKDGTIGKLALIEDDCPNEVSLNSGVMLIRSNNRIDYNNKFLYYVLKSTYFWDWYNSSQRGSSTIKHLYQEQFYNFSFYIPSKSIQDEIVKKLDKKIELLEKAIKYREEIINKLDEYKKSLIYEVVTGKKEV